MLVIDCIAVSETHTVANVTVWALFERAIYNMVSNADSMKLDRAVTGLNQLLGKGRVF